MRPGGSYSDDQELERSIHALADAFEADALPEERVVGTLEARLRRRRTGLMLSTAALAVAVVAAIAIGARGLSQPAVGGPAAMPDLVGLFVSEAPDRQGRCYAVRLYDTTAADGRVALWTWTGGVSCAVRTDGLSTGLGRAEGVRLASGPGIAVEAAAGVRPALEGLRLFIDGTPAQDGSLRAFPTVETPGAEVIPMQPAEELRVPYQPK